MAPRRRFLLRNIVPIPWYYPLGDDGGLPQQLVPESRMPVGESRALGLRVWFERERGERRPDADPLMEDALLWVEVSAESDNDALTAAAPALELVLDHLSFQLQVRVEPRVTDVLDVEPPVVVGDERDFFTLVEGYKPWKRRLSVDHGARQDVIPTPGAFLSRATIASRPGRGLCRHRWSARQERFSLLAFWADPALTIASARDALPAGSRRRS